MCSKTAHSSRRIFEMYVGGYGRGVIVRTPIKEGFAAWNTRKPVWHESYINKLLCNRAGGGRLYAVPRALRTDTLATDSCLDTSI